MALNTNVENFKLQNNESTACANRNGGGHEWKSRKFFQGDVKKAFCNRMVKVYTVSFALWRLTCKLCKCFVQKVSAQWLTTQYMVFRTNFQRTFKLGEAFSLQRKRSAWSIVWPDKEHSCCCFQIKTVQVNFSSIFSTKPHTNYNQFKLISWFKYSESVA